MFRYRLLLMVDSDEKVCLFSLRQVLECDHDYIVAEVLVVNRSETIQAMLAVDNPCGSVPVGKMQQAKLNACTLVYGCFFKPDRSNEVYEQIIGEIATSPDVLTDVSHPSTADKSLVGWGTFWVIEGTMIDEGDFEQVTGGCDEAIKRLAAEFSTDRRDGLAA